MNKGYQTNFSSLYAHNKEYESNRERKAKKTIAVIHDAVSGDLKNCNALEIGCFKGDISIHLAPSFHSYTAIDIDKDAINEALEKSGSSNVLFEVGNAEKLRNKDHSVDVVICSHIYEHVPNPEIMMSEIHRVLKDEGICYFAAANKLKIIEPHYGLPFLSWIPKPMAHLYLKITGKGDHYYESLRSIWGIKKLVRKFDLSAYSLRILRDPVLFHSDDMIIPGSFKQRIAVFVYKYLTFAFPTYIWVLRKKRTD